MWRVSSISSAPLLELELDDGLQDSGDGLSSQNASSAPNVPDAADIKVRDFDLHDESVATVAWSHCDAWVFASLSFDGRVLLNHARRPEPKKRATRRTRRRTQLHERKKEPP